MSQKCKCGHEKRNHMLQQGICMDDVCDCLHFDDATMAALVQIFCTGCYLECDAPVYRSIMPYCRLCAELLQPVAATEYEGQKMLGEAYWQLMEKRERQQRVQKKVWEF